MNSEFATHLADCPVIAILRGMDRPTSLAAAETALSAGIRCIEVPIQSDSAVRNLRELVQVFGAGDCHIGAGTVTTVAHVRMAVDAGATFTIAPGLDADVVRASTAAGLPHLPGVATPSEIQQAYGLGLTWMKAFPATALGHEWFRAVHGPFPMINLIATGGITVDNAQGFLDAGAAGLGVGAAMADPASARLLARCSA